MYAAFLVAAALLLATPVAGAGTYVVHRHSALDARPAAWARTPCGCTAATCGGADGSRSSDIVTSWGATVSPATPPLPEYPRPQLTRGNSSCVTVPRQPSRAPPARLPAPRRPRLTPNPNP